jgi:hypothetical protein
MHPRGRDTDSWTSSNSREPNTSTSFLFTQTTRKRTHAPYHGISRPTFYGIWKNKTVEEYSAVPYLATLLNCMMWLLYGLPAVTPDNMLIITINVIGITIELHYIALFLAYSVGAARRRVLLILVAEVSFVAAFAALVLNLAHTHVLRSMVVGILCVIVGTATYASPLSVMERIDPYSYLDKVKSNIMDRREY